MPWKGAAKKGVLPLMTGVQPAEKKVRSVLDFSKLNHHVKCNIDVDVINAYVESLRKWRQMTGPTTLVYSYSCMWRESCGATNWSSTKDRYTV